jgi:hypothetical protein
LTCWKIIATSADRTHVGREMAAGLHAAAEHANVRVATGVRAVQPAQVAQQRRLAGAGGAEQRDHLAAPHRERDTLQRSRRAEALAQRAPFDHGVVHLEVLRRTGGGSARRRMTSR